MSQSLSRRISRLALPLLRRAASSYIAGAELDDALAVVGALAIRGRASTIAFWDETGANAADVFNAYAQSARALGNAKLNCYLSVKAPSLNYSPESLRDIVDLCKSAETRLHFDSLGIESADRTRTLIEGLLPRYANISFTLPGRWARSLRDADWAVERGLAVRVVKGQWEDPTMPQLDPHAGFLRVIEWLAGRARAVAVATHNPSLAALALERLRKAGTPCELELLYGLPTQAVLKVATAMTVSVRVYVPYGYGWLPYSLSQAKKNPQILWWMFKDAMLRRPEAAI